MNMNTNITSPAFFQGLLPLRRIIALGITSATIFAGVNAVWAGDSQQTTYEIINRDDRTMSIIDGDDDRWECAGEASANTCAMLDSRLPGGPVEPLGYRTEGAASEACTNGTVRALWRRGQVVGYTCLVDWQQSLQGR